MDLLTDELIFAWKYGWFIDGWIEGLIGGWRIKAFLVWMDDAWMDGWMDGWLDGCMGA